MLAIKGFGPGSESGSETPKSRSWIQIRNKSFRMHNTDKKNVLKLLSQTIEPKIHQNYASSLDKCKMYRKL